MVEHHSNDSNQQEQISNDINSKERLRSDIFDCVKQSEGIWTRIKNGFQDWWFWLTNPWLWFVIPEPLPIEPTSEPPVTSNVVKTFSISDFIADILTWFNWLSVNYCINAVKVTTIPVVVLKDLIADAQSNLTSEMFNKYEVWKELLTDCNNQDIVGLAQNPDGDVIAASSFGAEDYSHQDDDARDYTIAINRNGDILKKIKLI